MTTQTLEARDDAPPARVRARNRPAVKKDAPVADAAPAPLEEVVPVEVAVVEEEPELTPEEAKAKAIQMVTEALALAKAANAAIAAKGKADKALAKFCKQHNVPTFAIKSGNDVYDVGEMALKEDIVDPIKLFAEIGHVEAMGLVKVSQGAVKDHGGAPLLAKVLTTITKPVEFKVKKRA